MHIPLGHSFMYLLVDLFIIELLQIEGQLHGAEISTDHSCSVPTSWNIRAWHIGSFECILLMNGKYLLSSPIFPSLLPFLSFLFLYFYDLLTVLLILQFATCHE